WRGGNTDAEIPGRIGADRHEGARADGYLAAIADQYVQADRRQRQNQEGDEDRLQAIVRCQQRNQHEGCGQQGQHEGPVLPNGEYLLVCPVGAFELAVFTIKHSRSSLAYTRSMIFSPNKPCGRKSRNTRASM